MRGVVELLDPAASADGPVKVLVPRLPLVLLVVSVAVEPAAMQAASEVLDELVPRLAVGRAVAAGVVRASSGMIFRGVADFRWKSLPPGYPCGTPAGGAF